MIQNISVIIPSYNAGEWLEKSIPKIDRAVLNAGFKKAEIIIIDDGSSDDTSTRWKKIKTQTELKYFNFQNGGRFLARKRGVEKAKYDHLLFIDTRIYISKNGLKFIRETQEKEPDRQVWTSHVILDKKGNIYARFWEAITFVAWRKYFRNPRDVSYGINEFDAYPKGTTCFFVPKDVILEANSWFETQTKDVKTSNDDTLLIRRIAAKNSININPEFSCIYHARTNLKQYIKHVHHRGRVFVDGFLRRDGNKLFYPLVTFLIVTAIAPFVFVFMPFTLLYSLYAFCICWCLIPLYMVMIGVGLKDAGSFFVLSPIFFFSYGLGIWKAFVKLYVK